MGTTISNINGYTPYSKYNEKGNSKPQNSTSKLSPSEEKQVQELQKIDQKVKAHEQAHLAAGAGLVRGGASFEYTTGPDGKLYAVAGEVKIDISPVPGKPQETIQKMERVIAAALAPADPSPQDRAVASTARNIEMNAAIEMSKNIVSTPTKNSNVNIEQKNPKETQSNPEQTKYSPPNKPINPYPSLKINDDEQNYYQSKVEETYAKQQKLDTKKQIIYNLV
ncbi:MAG: putative metalloprotease CJM1_0395 family protein [Candidatus Kapaibacteriota bacterium]